MIECSRCLQHREALDQPPLPDRLGEEIRKRICRGCWNEWREEEVRVINELKLNFIEPESIAILERRMRAFLQLETPHE